MNQWCLVYWRIYASLCLNELRTFACNVSDNCRRTWTFGVIVIADIHGRNFPDINPDILACLWAGWELPYHITYQWEPLQWRHSGRDSVANHQPHDCLLNHLLRRRSKKTSKLRVAGLCEGNSPGTGEFPAQMSNNAENVSIWWRHRGKWSYKWLRVYCMHAVNISGCCCFGTDGDVSNHSKTNVNSLAPGKFEYILLIIDGWGISCEISLKWMSLDFTDNLSTLV